jgi:hypothetical protein
MNPLPRVVALATVLLLGACTSPTPIPITPPAETRSSSVVRRPAEPAPPAAQAPAPAVPPLASPAPSSPRSGIVVPADAIYVCLSERDGQRTQTVIEFVPKVHALCRKHPEMGPCQYERNLCRASGGRVYAANGQEITMATEAEYDKKVMRVRFKAN